MMNKDGMEKKKEKWVMNIDENDEESMDKIKEGLGAPNKELGLQNADKRELMLENQLLREAQLKVRTHLNTLKTQVVENEELKMKGEQLFQEAKMEYQKQLEKKQKELEAIKMGTRYKIVEEER
ncbi:hypothetical protein P8452_44205 [Trifolium repens]|nr:hypothetical protein P8452_44205 [Trifolium repens]